MCVRKPVSKHLRIAQDFHNDDQPLEKYIKIFKIFFFVGSLNFQIYYGFLHIPIYILIQIEQYRQLNWSLELWDTFRVPPA